MNLEDDKLKHIAIIMDGNGRWAENKGLERTAGHAAGEESLSKTIHWALENNLKWLTVYAFSTENWLRSSDEVEFLMFLLISDTDSKSPFDAIGKPASMISTFISSKS